jgi:hypothetical protein
MAHEHHHHDRNTYFLEQLFTVFVCGALGLVALISYFTDVKYLTTNIDGTEEVVRNCKLSLLLHPKFHVWVLVGGVTLLSMVVIRIIALWFQVDRGAVGPAHELGCCGHDHSQEHPHAVQEVRSVQGVDASLPAFAAHSQDSDHNHEHTVGHGHDHGWSPWRYAVLMVPLVLYFLNLPNKGFQVHAGGFAGIGEVAAPKQVADRGHVTVGFLQLEEAALTREKREFYAGKTVRLTGQYADYDPWRFTLIRLKRSCCAADAVPVKALIMVDPSSKEGLDTDKLRDKWVEVTGRIAFVKDPRGDRYVTALIVYPSTESQIQDLVRIIPPDPYPWLN